MITINTSIKSHHFIDNYILTNKPSFVEGDLVAKSIANAIYSKLNNPQLEVQTMITGPIVSGQPVAVTVEVIGLKDTMPNRIKIKQIIQSLPN